MFWKNNKKNKQEIKKMIVSIIEKEVIRLEGIRRLKPTYEIKDYTVQSDLEIEEVFNEAYQMGRERR